MASNSAAASAGASTPGGAGASTPGRAPLKVAQWNLGLNTADAFQRDNRIAHILDTTADTVAEMLINVDIVCLNELHAAHQAQLDHLLAWHGVRFMGFNIGDAVAWRRYDTQ